jgi:phage terminase small subunit
MVIAELALIGFSDVGNLFTEDGGLKHISAMTEEVTRTIQEVTSRFERARGSDDGEVAEIVKIKTYDKKGALDSLAKHFGLFEKDNQQSKTEINPEWTITVKKPNE